MTRELRDIIEDIINNPDNHKIKVLKLETEYTRAIDNMTETALRIEFLENCLRNGMSKREAARKLVEHDPRVGQGTAENLVYTNFSGQYQTSTVGQSKKSKYQREDTEKVKNPEVKISIDIEDEEDLL